MQGNPQNMQDNPQYDNVVNDVFSYFGKQLNYLRANGVKDIILDPGFGFGKSLEHNYDLLANMNIYSALECPLLAGISRKSMIYRLLDSDPEKAVNGTTALNMMALMKGADILRVHDVREAREVITLFNKLNEYRV